MPMDIYHSKYTTDRHGVKKTTDITETHDEHDDTDIESETVTETEHYKGDDDGCI